MSDNKLIRQHFDITLKAIYKDTFTKMSLSTIT